jgi:hypothetical protein
MQELLPIACGLLIGALTGGMKPSMQVPSVAALAVVFGTIATVVSGEFRVSWAFLLIDIPLVALSAVVALVFVRLLRGYPALR